MNPTLEIKYTQYYTFEDVPICQHHSNKLCVSAVSVCVLCVYVCASTQVSRFSGFRV
jgi:hypothetical protein